MIKEPEVKKDTEHIPEQPPAPRHWAVFAIDRKGTGRVQITKPRKSIRAAKFDEGDVKFGTEQCLLDNRITVDEIT